MAMAMECLTGNWVCLSPPRVILQHQVTVQGSERRYVVTPRLLRTANNELERAASMYRSGTCIVPAGESYGERMEGGFERALLMYTGCRLVDRATLMTQSLRHARGVARRIPPSHARPNVKRRSENLRDSISVEYASALCHITLQLDSGCSPRLQLRRAFRTCHHNGERGGVQWAVPPPSHVLERPKLRENAHSSS